MPDSVEASQLMEQCTAYFKANGGFKKLFEKMRDKYRLLGSAGGSVVLKNLKKQEKEALTGFLRRDFASKESVTVRLQDFQKALDGTRFEGVKLEDLLKAYFEDELVSNRQIRDTYQEQRSLFFNTLIGLYRTTPAGSWLSSIFDTMDNAYRTLLQRYDADNFLLEQDLHAVCRAVNSLPVYSGKTARLPVFASAITKNPHAFDDGTACGQLLLHAIVFCLDAARPANAEEKAELYYRAGILFDEVSSVVLCSGLLAYSEGKVHQGWQGFYNSMEPIQASMMNLSRLDRALSPNRRIYVFENPGVFAAIIDKTRNLKPSLICTYGQVKLAALVLLDMLIKEDVEIYYSGDFDPEGLRIADRLKERYGEGLKLWRFTVEDYISAISEENINHMRQKKLEGLKNPELLLLAEKIRESGRAGYQELLIDRLIEDIYLK